MLSDRRRLQRQWVRLQRRTGQPSAPELAPEQARLQAAMAASAAIAARRRAAIPAIDYPAELPVSERRAEIAAQLRAHQVIVLCGETGSGKSTQLPKLCLELGRGIYGRIGHTQPRRIAARSLAGRIAQETGTELGTTIGYKVRFHDRVRPETSVKLMTDGILLAELQQDRFLNEYDTLIIDEAHERTLNIDFLLGYLRQLLPRRPDLKLIVTSATIDPQRFARHFGNAPIIEVSGRTYPVEVRYQPPAEESAGERDEAMQQAIVAAVDELARAGRGDVLIFLSGEREIRATAETLRKHHPPGTELLPLYARQGPAEQGRIFQPHGARRVVLATNVAETALTVPGIHYVVDPGFARISRYSHRTKVQRLPVERISRASADQRKGRCGRVAAGICIRLYSEDNFQARAAFTEPEIRRTNLAAVILQMKLLGFGAIETFPFIDPPDPRLISDGYRTLEELAALDTDGRLTPLGRQLARLPVDPRIGRMLLAAGEQHCLHELLIIAAALSVQDPRERPLERQQAADEIHASFAHPQSDFLGLLNLWHFLEEERARLSRRRFQEACRLHFLSWTRVQEWRDIHAQLREQMLALGQRENATAATYEQVHRALLAGLLGNLGNRDGEHDYQGARGARFRIHPGSALFKAAPKWLVCAERVETTRQYGRTVARVQPGWIEAVGAHLVKRSYSEAHWQSKAGQVAAFETVTLFGVTLVSRRRVNYGPINPAEAREVFLRSALVDGDFETRAPFWRHNVELIDYVRHLEAKSRRRDLLVDEEAIYAFYAERIPSGIWSTPQFERWLRRVSRTEPKLLSLRLADVLRREAGDLSAERFPDRLRVGATELPLEYQFDPGQPTDGLTLILPLPLLNQLAPERLEWLVPGLLAERVTALLRGLPKAVRRALVPIPDTAARIAARLQPSDRPLVQAIAEAVRDLTGVQIPEDAWDPAAIPPHLRMKVRLVDAAGQTLASGEDLIALKRRHGGDAATGAAPPAWGHALERAGIRRWDFGDLPESVDLERAGLRLRAWPALVDQGDSVALHLLDSAAAAHAAMRAGLRRLILLELGGELRGLRRNPCAGCPHGPLLERLQLQYARAAATGAPPAANAAPMPVAQAGADLADDLLALALDLTFLEARPPLRDQASFAARIAAHRDQLPATATTVCTLTAQILGLYQDLRRRLAATTQRNWLPSVLDLQQQLDGLVFRGFLVQVPYANLRDYPRYLRAAAQRLDKLGHAAGRDQDRLRELTPLLTRWQERRDAAQAAGRDDPRLTEIRWLLEELRVSLFAQQVGTARPVSVKRIETRWRELGL
ncbi:MAG: ATP-dependent RNA helicase HrpA [Chromatiaceae bacterium]|nr:MAG: ATP-dependent RNA helicase HrpA [Chromatiaceae bacterium]